MYTVKFSNGAYRAPEKVVDGNTTMKAFLEEQGGNTGTLMFNGSTLSEGLKEKTFSELAAFYGLADGAEIIVFDAPKTANAA